MRDVSQKQQVEEENEKLSARLDFNKDHCSDFTAMNLSLQRHTLKWLSLQWPSLQLQWHLQWFTLPGSHYDDFHCSDMQWQAFRSLSLQSQAWQWQTLQRLMLQEPLQWLSLHHIYLRVYVLCTSTPFSLETSTYLCLSACQPIGTGMHADAHAHVHIRRHMSCVNSLYRPLSLSPCNS